MAFLATVHGFCGHMPARIAARPIRRHNAVAEMDVRVDPVFHCGFVDIFMYCGAIGDGFFMQPRLEAVTERMHVGVRPDTGIAKQIPGSAHVGALLYNRIAFVRALHRQMRRSTNA